MLPDTLRNSAIQILEDAGLPQFNEADFTKCNIPIARGGGRSRLVSGTLQTVDGHSSQVVIKVLRASYAYTKRVKNVDEYITKLLAYFEREVDIWKRASGHCNVVRLMGFFPSFEGEMFPALVLPKYELGSLRSIASAVIQIFGKQDKLILLRDVAQGLAYLHSSNIIHRDIKGANILVTHDERIIACINDFGSAKLMHPILDRIANSTQTNSLRWSPPEFVNNVEGYSYSRPTPASDMWSFGCLFLEVFTGVDPWKGSFEVEEELEQNRHPPIPSDVDIASEYVEFMLMCWKTQPQERISAERAVELIDDFIKRLS
ncbi:kinase-like protein [Fomitiporia mediterranea MF3/22]|uniref:kinase-like protein n=1 Tax=Fomitiporia mediterranea (strain MF3/22) TaxID=694068 RepID=UPI000440920C|nr:kinase-like protein [Fomitiporia mediterranea MF3/22]EJC99792.1 kinase-like protein [Fomitiporia mediterranea MF3/22]